MLYFLTLGTHRKYSICQLTLLHNTRTTYYMYTYTGSKRSAAATDTDHARYTSPTDRSQSPLLLNNSRPQVRGMVETTELTARLKIDRTQECTHSRTPRFVSQLNYYLFDELVHDALIFMFVLLNSHRYHTTDNKQYQSETAVA
jgi:hypothetical protein